MGEVRTDEKRNYPIRLYCGHFSYFLDEKFTCLGCGYVTHHVHGDIAMPPIPVPRYAREQPEERKIELANLRSLSDLSLHQEMRFLELSQWEDLNENVLRERRRRSDKVDTYESDVPHKPPPAPHKRRDRTES